MSNQRIDRLQTSEITLSVIEALYELDGAGVSELASHLDVAPSTVHRHLSTLSEMGYVDREQERYYLGLRFLQLGEYVHTRKTLYDSAKKYTEMLAEETNCRSVFLVAEHDVGVYIHTAAGKHGLWTKSTIGKRVPLHATAAGKVVLAFDDTLNVAELELEEFTPQTITSAEELQAELQTIRDRNYALNMEEQISGVRAVGAPVFDADETVVGAFSVSGPVNQMQEEWLDGSLPQTILGIANEFELQMKLS
ncbi:helix-turn-helix domain-containing protein [Natronorubrum sp. JWXQ-INN-674]|uniref:Helix-turn-helix domain-containing protein n=1 Tax=Natronorubrum halalkaliphilum TaxID=2691917 RepID=A0A6B0VHD7_9EURY|nr:IclR family transcriptional regulator [Natronorubrum halalkaliphilum]MXV60525.1 helix-turn-helix domain-containing protein [Natronorubrum halalkaliphilum]